MSAEESVSKNLRPDLFEPFEDARFLAFLPMLYVAWADGELEDEEVRRICAHSSALDGDCQGPVSRWLDPESPPSPRELQRLLSLIRERGSDLAGAERLSLVDLGLELARSGGHEPGAQELAALRDIDGALGITGSEVSRHVLGAPRARVSSEEPDPSFSLSVMARVLEGGSSALRAELKELLCAPPFERVSELSKEEYREQVLAWCKALAEGGYGALSFAPEDGGRSDQRAFVAAFETIALFDLSLLIKFGVQFGLFGGSILQLGTERHHRKFLGATGRLELPGCFAMTETGHGSNVYDLETVARYDAQTDEFVIQTPHRGAGKDYIGNAAAHGRMATVFAQLEVADERHGVHALLVPIRDAEGEAMPGVTLEDCGEKLGLNGVDNGRLWFDAVRVPRENLLDRFASVDDAGTYASSITSPAKRFFTMLGTLVGGRVSIALAAHSAAKTALTVAVRYGVRRRQFGPEGAPERILLDYLSHQRRLLPRLATTYAISFALQHLVDRYVDGSSENRREVESLAAGLKAYSTWHASDTIQECREACGGKGYLAENRFAALKADTDIFTTFEGDNTVLLQLVAKGLLSGFRQQFGHVNVWTLTRYIAAQAATAVTELNPVITRRTEREHLLDREFQGGALRYREQHLVATLARRMKRRLDAGLDALDALSQCQDHALSAALAHVERLIFENFAAAIGSVEDADVAEALGTQCDLFALTRIEADRGWFLEQGYIEPVKSKAIRSLVNELLGEVRPQALALVNAFDIPDALLGAPIALGD